MGATRHLWSLFALFLPQQHSVPKISLLALFPALSQAVSSIYPMAGNSPSLRFTCTSLPQNHSVYKISLFPFLPLCVKHLVHHILWQTTGHLWGLLALFYPNHTVFLKPPYFRPNLLCRRQLVHHILWLATRQLWGLLHFSTPNPLCPKSLYYFPILLCPSQLVHSFG